MRIRKLCIGIFILLGFSVGEKGETMTTKWQFALCQHPMWLIIDEDTVCAERTPPWGAPSLEVYVERLRRNLDALERYRELKINFDTSGVELEDMAARYPDIIEKMKKYVRQDRLAFLNGTYSQPHLQNFGLESMLRQFKYGLDVYHDLFKYPVNTYAAQEVGITEQLPQVLKSLDYRFAVVPHFSWALTFLTPHEVVGYRDHLEPIQGYEFTSWQGLDKTDIPLYITQVLFNKGITDEGLEFETVKDLYQGPPIKAFTPDLIEVDEEWVRKQIRNGEFVLLDDALGKRIKETPPLSVSRFYTYWSYVEGIGAEALSRANMEAENTVIQAEIVDAFLSSKYIQRKPDFNKLWKTILKSQHHDAYWVGAPELRKKSIQWLKDVTGEAKDYTENLVSSIPTAPAEGINSKYQSVIVFTTYAKPFQTVGKLEFPQRTANKPILKNKDNKELPSQFHTGLDGKNFLYFPVESKGVGFQTIEVANGNLFNSNSKKEINKPITWSNPYYQARIYPDGTFGSLQLKGNKMELLKNETYHGNELKTIIDGIESVSSRGNGSSVLMEGELMDVIRTKGKLGKTEFIMDIFLYHELPWMDMEIEFDFQDTEIGDFVKDETKLNLYWPMKENAKIFYGIGGGTVEAFPKRPIFAINWVDMETQNGSLALLNHGTLKHWTNDNVLAMVIGWGKEGNQFTNRLHANWSKSFDLRLKGKHLIRYSVYPHSGDWKKSNLPSWSMAQNHMPITVFSNVQKSSSKNFITLPVNNLVPTAIMKKNKKILCRAYESMGISINNNTKGFPKNIQIFDLKGKKIKQINPYQIVELEL